VILTEAQDLLSSRWAGKPTLGIAQDEESHSYIRL
jgi:hypothetical protein